MQRFFVSLVTLFWVFSLALSAQNAESSAETPRKNVKKVYLFGIAQNLNDTIVYVSDVTEVTGATLGKGGFLNQRSLYSQQFRDYLSATFGTATPTTAVFFFDTPQKALRKLEKISKKQSERKRGMPAVRMQKIAKSEFHFTLPTAQ